MQPPISSETLAHWKYTQTEWQDYVSFVLNDRSKTYKSSRYWVIGIIVIAFLMMTFFMLISYFLKPSQSLWREEVWGPLFGVAFITFVILASIGFGVLFFKEKDRKLKLSLNVEVLITPNSVVTNGSSFIWEFEINSICRFEVVERKTVATGEGKNIEILQFKCSTRFTKHREDVIERILIPIGKITEAEQIIARLFAEKKRFAEY